MCSGRSAVFWLSCFLAILVIPGCERQRKPRIYHMHKRIVYVLQDTSGAEKKAPAVPRDTSYLEDVFSGYDLVNIRDLDSSIAIDLRYAGTNNFLKRDFYDGLRNAYFTCDMAIRICNAQTLLKKVDSTLTLVILDAARPQHIQQLMWDSLDLVPERKFNYLSPPEATSMHNYGCAADVTIANAESGQPLDMGTEYDFFGRLSQPAFEQEFAKTGELSDTALYNRKLLRYVMNGAGLRGIKSEWWHFSLCTRPEAAARYPLIR